MLIAVFLDEVIFEGFASLIFLLLHSIEEFCMIVQVW
jgi:hypothetical protein